MMRARGWGLWKPAQETGGKVSLCNQLSRQRLREKTDPLDGPVPGPLLRTTAWTVSGLRSSRKI